MSNIIYIPADEDTDGLTRAEVRDLEVDETTMEMAYEESLNDVYGDASICGYAYEAAYALKEVDPIAFRVGYADYVSAYYAEVDVRDFPESVES